MAGRLCAARYLGEEGPGGRVERAVVGFGQAGVVDGAVLLHGKEADPGNALGTDLFSEMRLTLAAMASARTSAGRSPYAHDGSVRLRPSRSGQCRDGATQRKLEALSGSPWPS